LALNETDRSREDDWFRRNEQELLEAARRARLARQQEREAAEKAEERKRLRDLHHMKCPKCGHDMKAQDALGIEVDRCTFCEGLYLDAGELEKLFGKRLEDRKAIWRRVLGL
jgi:hypothetical protein